MKLLALCGFFFVFLLCLSAFTAEGQTIKVCCSMPPKLNKKAHKGINFKITRMEIRKYCKPCSRRAPPVVPGPLPQLK